VLAAGDLALLALELPTGRFADRYGHRASLILGSLIQVVAMVCCWLGRGVPELVAASVLVAVGDAFRSGANEALLYRSCVALGREEAFQRIEGRAETTTLVALVAMTLAGGAIATMWSVAAAWVVETAFCFAGLVMACAMTEPAAAADDSDEGRGARRTLITRQMAALIVPSSLLGAAASAAGFLAQTGESEIGPITLLVAGITLAEAAGAAIAARMPATGARGQMVLAALTALLCSVAIVLPFSFNVVLMALCVVDGMSGPLRSAAIQRIVADDVRATAASLANACDMALSTLTLPLVGAWRRG
jgi:hypothetical protein